MFKYQELIEKLSVEEVNATLKRMVDNYDLTGKYYDTKEYEINNVLQRELYFKNYFLLSPEFLDLLEKYAQKEIEDEKRCGIESGNDPIDFFIFNDVDSSTPNPDLKEEKKKYIYRSLLDYIESKAKKILENREHLRIPIGGTVDFKECILSNHYLGKMEFYKDGGWGIAEEDGKVLIKNHLKQQPSRNQSLYRINTHYRIIQDRDTKKYGVLSLTSFYEAIHCHYDKIEAIVYYLGQENHFFLKVMKNDKWGCYDENCALLIECNYDDIKLKGSYYECTRDSRCLFNDTLGEKGYNGIHDGTRDLYNNEGILLLGGYDHLEIEYDYLKFYFGATYESSLCLILDKYLRTIIKNKDGYYQLSRGKIFNSKTELSAFIPSDFLFRHRVDLSDYYGGYIYLHDYYGAPYTVPYYIWKGFNTPEELDASMEKAKKDFPFGIDVQLPQLYDDNRDYLIDNPIVSILRINNQNEIEWIDYANDIIRPFSSVHIYRNKEKCGFFDEKGLQEALYDAISIESPDNKTYVAFIEYCQYPKSQLSTNPNFTYPDYHGYKYIHYFTFDVNGNLIRIKDNWDIFNPTKCKWFPDDFIENNYDVDTEGASDFYSEFDNGYEWTDEDAWDAMTDGMYGDYPGPGWDPEWFGF